ncbi:hypothetical protein WICMUC_002300 [Wickerhamomyces mucosus]|uniref:Protein kinase domain-containing protein n=1 Tax=Wickerhamomyces mucosus TaxID=1378264 RepID=A0A9P8PRI4_9ASCO|nr:hypothetical protein WICMUC_002300 [Wickerhamomyces mucosus]
MAMFNNLKNLIRNKHHSNTSNSSIKDRSNSNNIHIQHESKYDSNGKSFHIENNSSNTELQDSIPYHKELNPRYTIISRIGEGAFSKVYKSHDNQLNITVAIKIIEKSKMSNSQIDSILKEISIMRRLDHPNVVKLHNFINTKTHTFLVIEYISGGELFNQIIKYTYFSEELARHIIIQVVKAVDYLHSEVGVVHRDIKPENLLFEFIPFIPSKVPKSRKSDDANKLDEGEFINGSASVGTIKLADFGLSKILWDSNTKTPCGTASYTAPEIVKDESYSKSVDMWAIGCVLYTLLCGFPPFYNTDPKVLTLKVSKGDYTFLSPWWDEISKEAKDLVSHLLTVDPMKRFTPDDVLNHPWILKNSKPTTPAPDAPLYKTKNNDSILKFEDTIPNIQHNNISYSKDKLSPRAEALKFAFDTGISVQRTNTPLRRLLDHQDYFNESDEDDDMDEDDDEQSYYSEDDSAGSSSDDEDDDYERNFTYYTNSPIVKKFHNSNSQLKLTPYVKKLHSSRSKELSSDESLGNSVHVLKQPKPTSVQRSVFKEINNQSFNLNMEQNTLLNRRKRSASVKN